LISGVYQRPLVVYEEMGTEGLRLDRLKVNDLFNIIYIMRIYVCGRRRNVTLIVVIGYLHCT